MNKYQKLLFVCAVSAIACFLYISPEIQSNLLLPFNISTLGSASKDFKDPILIQEAGKVVHFTENVDFRIIILTHKRFHNLQKLLNSLQNLELDGDKGAVEIWIDPTKEDLLSLQTFIVAKNFKWEKGDTRVRIHNTHVGILGQWIDTWTPMAKGWRQEQEIALILEDDMVVGRYSYRFLRLAHQKYGDRDDFAGVALQCQYLNAHNTGRALRPPHNHTAFMYAAIGTWGFSPSNKQWPLFQEWYHQKKEKNDKIKNEIKEKKMKEKERKKKEEEERKKKEEEERKKKEEEEKKAKLKIVTAKPTKKEDQKKKLDEKKEQESKNASKIQTTTQPTQKQQNSTQKTKRKKRDINNQTEKQANIQNTTSKLTNTTINKPKSKTPQKNTTQNQTTTKTTKNHTTHTTTHTTTTHTPSSTEPAIFYPLVKGIKPSKWYEDFLSRNFEDSMWSMWFVYFAYHRDLYTVFSNILLPEGKRVCLAANSLSSGLHFGGKGIEDIEKVLLPSWNESYAEGLPDHLVKFDWNGKEV